MERERESMVRASTDGRTNPCPARPIHRQQGIRYAGRDYRIPAFYMITMATLGRKPLFATCENAKSTLNDDGWLVYQLWHRMAKDYAQVETSTLIIMPDHLHGIVRVKEQMAKPVGVPLRAFKSQVTSALRKRYGNPEMKVWTPGYHDLAVWRRGALAAYTHYLIDNPRRHCLKKENPDLFSRVNNLRHPRLPQDETWSGYGNLFLLDQPELRELRVSRSIPPDQLEELRKETLEWIKSGGVIVSPFISPGEKEIAKTALDAGGAVILMKPDGFDRYFKPRGKYFDLCLQGKLLILACRPCAPAASTLTREICLRMNRWCTEIAKPLS
jgi:REP element-mobilizing transposase RayT